MAGASLNQISHRAAAESRHRNPGQVLDMMRNVRMDLNLLEISSFQRALPEGFLLRHHWSVEHSLNQ